jgi:hypothetical protein
VLNLYEEFRAVIHALDDAGIPYALCGGLAMAIWDEPRATVDIDLLLRGEALHAAYEAIAPLGFVVRALPMKFSAGAIEIRRVSKFDPSGGDVLMIDFLIVTEAVEDVWASRVSAAWEDRTISVVSREGLIKLKSFRSSGRDLDDIKRLERR